LLHIAGNQAAESRPAAVATFPSSAALLFVVGCGHGASTDTEYPRRISFFGSMMAEAAPPTGKVRISHHLFCGRPAGTWELPCS